MENLNAGDLLIQVVEFCPPHPIQLVWKGKSVDRHPNRILRPFFESVLQVAENADVPIELDFQKLEHFNSSTVTSVIELIQNARARAVKLVLTYDSALKWQRLSFDALRVFAKADNLLELRAS